MKNSRNNSFVKALLGCTSVVAMTTVLSLPAAAQIEEIIVTATKREASIMDVPISIAAIQEETLENAGIESISDLSSIVAGVISISQGPGSTSISIRGVSEFVDDFFVNPTVGIYIDEVPLVTHPSYGPELGFFDASRVEVLRGPQGTLFGDGSMGGTIRVVTNKPDMAEVEGRLNTQWSNWDEGGDNVGIKGLINFPIVEDKLALRLSGAYEDNGGYIDNELPGTLVKDTKDVNTYQASSIRAALRAKPIDEMTLDLVYSHNELDVDDVAEENFPRVKNRNLPEPNSNNLDTVALTLTYDFGAATLVSATSFTKIEQANKYEITDSTLAFWPILQFLTSPTFDTYVISAFGFEFERQQDIFSQEVRLSSNGDGPWNWTVGGFYRKDEREEFEDIYSGPDNITGTSPLGLALDYTFTMDSKQYALFGEVDYQIDEAFNFLLGARYYKEEQDSAGYNVGWINTFFFGGGVVSKGSETFDTFIPKAVLTYTPNDNLTAYISYSEGFRAGGVNSLANAAALFGDPVPSGFDPESLSALELGVKSILLDGRLRANAYVYQNKWDDMINGFTNTVNFGYNANTGKADITGGEVELVATPTDGLTLSANASFINAEFQDTVYAHDGVTVLVSPGDRVPNIPEVSFAFSGEYRIPMDTYEAMLRADYQHRGSTYSEASNAPISKTDELNILNIRGGLEGDTWGAYIFVNNVTGEDGAILSYSPLNPSFNAVDRTFVAPQEVGVELRLRF